MEIKGAGFGITNENGRTSMTLVEVEPFLSLNDCQ
jgi:hypothetical protein